MDGSPTAGVLIITTPFPVDDNNHRSIDLSPLEFILALIAIITIPSLIYAFFYSIRCPPDPLGSGRRRSSGIFSDTETVTSDRSTSKEASNSDVKYPKEDEDVKELIEGECPICLSAFLDGEEWKKLSVCKHLFHVSCIDKWLGSHSDCPVCRTGVEPPVKRSTGSTAAAARDRGNDLQQGFPDASSLV